MLRSRSRLEGMSVQVADGQVGRIKDVLFDEQNWIVRYMIVETRRPGRSAMMFRQLFESVSCTYTYLLGCEDTGQAILVDPVIASMDRDLDALEQLGLRLAYSVDTHIHADHVTAALALRKRVGSRIAAPANERVPCADVNLADGKPFQVGSIVLNPLHPPGHTSGHFAYALPDRVFTGDALLIDGCGRTDFQNGDADALYKSVREAQA